MALYLYKNGDMSLVETTNKVTTPSICYYKNGTKYVPLITKTGSVNIGNKKYSYTTVRPTIHVVYNSTEYVVPNDYQVLPYDILAGTYSPSTFEDLVNGQTYNVPAGRAICYTFQYAGTARFVTFSGSQRGGTQFELNQFSSQGVYCTYWLNRGAAASGQGNTYYQYNITVSTGIKFN